MAKAPNAGEVLPVVFSVLIAIVVFGALLLTMTSTFTDIAADTANFSAGARGLADIGPLLLIVGLIALPIGLAVWLFTRFV